jgi:CHAT domain-containing protein
VSLATADLAPLLEGGQNVILKFVTTGERTFLFVVHEKEGKPALETLSLSLSGDELSRRASSFRTLLAERALDWQQPSRALYAALLREAEPFFAGASRLTIIPDGPLWELPFQTLQDAQKHCLLEKFAISYAPSPAFLAQAQTAKAASTPRLLALADPALNTKTAKFSVSALREAWEPLPSADHEVKELEKLYRPERSMILTGPAAREKTFKQRAGDFDVLHFATHGVINDRAPLYSYLLMSQKNLAPNEDGLLEAWELMELKLHARLAVLSACETARGKISEGEGVIGLAWAFLAAGCPAEIVSQWKVDSASDTELMVNFHRRLRAGASAAAALRLASLDLAKNSAYRHPFYWAPFVVLGAQ